MVAAGWRWWGIRGDECMWLGEVEVEGFQMVLDGLGDWRGGGE